MATLPRRCNRAAHTQAPRDASWGLHMLRLRERMAFMSNPRTVGNPLLSKRGFAVVAVAAALSVGAAISVAGRGSGSVVRSNPNLSTLLDLNSAPANGVSSFAVAVRKGEKIEFIVQVWNHGNTDAIANQVNLVASKGVTFDSAYLMGPDNSPQAVGAQVGWRHPANSIDLPGAHIVPSEATGYQPSSLIVRATITGNLPVEVGGIRVKGSDASGPTENVLPLGFSGCANEFECKIPASSSVLKEIGGSDGMGR